MVNVEKAARSIGKLTLLKYFPGDPDARAALVEMVCGMAQTDDQIDWLCRRALQVFNEWPGPHELRALYCKRFKPRDGVDAYSAIYVDGFPSEAELEGRISAPAPLPQIARGAPVSADPELSGMVEIARKVTRMPKTKDGAA